MGTGTIGVLVVDDDREARRYAVSILRSMGMAVTEAVSVTEAKDRYAGGLHDVVLMGMRLPDGTGYQLADWLWQQRPGLPVVMSSADFGGVCGTLSQFLVPGRLTMLMQPFSADDLLNALGRVMPYLAAAHPGRGAPDRSA